MEMQEDQKDQSKRDEEAIEEIIDRRGLADFMALVGSVCLDKEDHMRGEWQDEAKAKEWAKHARWTMALAERLDK